ncbi:MAG: hypothetical protein RLZZ347_546 [Candidatus Parcubacteria bacterium]|jgi:DNA-binding Lrp family transcriptional regulator
MTDILGQLFGTPIRVKLLRLFIFNPERVYHFDELASRVKASASKIKPELAVLERAGVIKTTQMLVEVSGKKTEKKKKVSGYVLSERCAHLQALRNLLLAITPFTSEEIAKRISKTGKIKLTVLSGVFIQQYDARIDLLVVGDKIKMPVLERLIKTIESELGRELRYVILETADFQYRLSVHDKLVRDVFDFPHQLVTDLLGVRFSV